MSARPQKVSKAAIEAVLEAIKEADQHLAVRKRAIDLLFSWVGDVNGFWLAFCPHPSAVSRWWNSPTNVAKAVLFWRQLEADAP